MPKRLLLADDSVTVQRVIELTFADEDVAVVAVGDGDQAVKRLESEPFDIVLADVGMPGRDGYEVARFVRERPDLSGIPVILLTGAFEKVDETRIAASGASAVMAKPFEPHMVIMKVRELLGRGRTHAVTVDGTPAPPIVADAPATSPAGAGTPTGSVDDYFERLDRAFASLEPHIETNSKAPPAPAPAPPSAPAPAPAAAVTAASQADAPRASTPASAPPRDLADTFATLLAVEQGELPDTALLPPPQAGDDELVDRIARRVVERLGDSAVRELAADIVSRTAERLVREEIERLKRGH